MKCLLVIRLGALGDLIHVSPSLEAVKHAHPEVEIHLLTSPLYKSLASSLSGVDQVWQLDKKQGFPGLFRLAGQLRKVGIDGVVNLHPSLKTALLAQLVLPKKQTVYHKEKLRIKGKNQRTIKRRHAIADFFVPFRRFFGLLEMQQAVPCLNLNLAESALTIQKTLSKPQQEQWIGIIPGVGAKRSNRAWEPEGYEQLIQALLAESQYRILLIGGPDEQPLAQRLLESIQDADKHVENHCGIHDILGTAALLAQCDVVIGGDTGPMHVAAAVGVPLVGIYGPTSLARTGPVGNHSMKLLTPPAELACWPCELSECPYIGERHLACMKQIPVSQVLEACHTVLAI